MPAPGENDVVCDGDDTAEQCESREHTEDVAARAGAGAGRVEEIGRGNAAGEHAVTVDAFRFTPPPT
jgi:hypothetical protein